MNLDCDAGRPKAARVVKGPSCERNAAIVDVTLVNLSANREKELAASDWPLAHRGEILA